MEGHSLRICSIEELAVNIAGTQLLYFSQGEQQGVVDPVNYREAGHLGLN